MSSAPATTVNPERVFAGFGSGLTCAVCNYPIEHNQVEYEVTVGGAEPMHMHLRCFIAWWRRKPGPA